MSILVSVLLILLYMLFAAAMFFWSLQDYHYRTATEYIGAGICALIWPIVLAVAAVTIIQMEIGRWRDRRD